MPLTLRVVTPENWRTIARLAPREDQQRFVASNLYSLAEAHYEEGLHPLGIYDGETPVGFTMWGGPPATEAGIYWVVRLMVDQRFQRMGFGRAAMGLLLADLRAQPDCRTILISTAPDNDPALALYESLGFVRTGEILDGEAVLRLDVSKT